MQVELRTLFNKIVIDFAAGEVVKLKLPNIPFTPPTDENLYFAIDTLPVSPSVHSVNGESRFRFILQISIYSRDGIGEIKAMAYADTIRETLFPLNSNLVGSAHSFKVITPPAPAPNSISIDVWILTPVRFTVETFA